MAPDFQEVYDRVASDVENLDNTWNGEKP